MCATKHKKLVAHRAVCVVLHTDSIPSIFSPVRVKARQHCKSPGQIDGATWSSGMTEQLKSSGVDDELIVFITSNEADWLRYPVWLNGGKHQRKANRLHSINFFSAAIFIIHSPPDHNRRTLEFAILRLRQTFLKIFNSQKCWTKTQYYEFDGPVIYSL